MKTNYAKILKLPISICHPKVGFPISVKLVFSLSSCWFKTLPWLNLSSTHLQPATHTHPITFRVILKTTFFQVWPTSRCHLVERKERSGRGDGLPPNGDLSDNDIEHYNFTLISSQAETMNGAFRHSISLVPQQPEDITNFTCIAWLVTFSSPLKLSAPTLSFDLYLEQIVLRNKMGKGMASVLLTGIGRRNNKIMTRLYNSWMFVLMLVLMTMMLFE